jgi:hypothetical protein
MNGFNSKCPNCSDQLVIKDLSCDSCGLELRGKVQLPRLARLYPEDREFIEMFVLASGSLKEVGTLLNISYPTVRQRLNETIKKLQALHAEREKERLSILEMLEQGKISPQEAIELLKHGEEKIKSDGEK